jgi:S1-C subfamily serine protease
VNLNELFMAASRSVVCFINKLDRGPLGTPKPLFPQIIGTGFLLDSNGIAVTNRHVAAAFNKLRANPRTGESSLGAVLFLPGDVNNSWQMVVLEVLEWFGLANFKSSDKWYGEKVPDIGFVQIGASELPFLKLATEDYYLKIGMSISTIGYPMGRLPLTALGKLHQASAFIRHGIVSSVFPFPNPHPHGFTIDVMQQGGSSGSPIFREDGRVVGMMKSSVLEWGVAQAEHPNDDNILAAPASVTLAYPQNTNISIAEPAHIIDQAYQAFRTEVPQASGLKTLAQIRAEHPLGSVDDQSQWDSWIEPSQ